MLLYWKQTCLVLLCLLCLLETAESAPKDSSPSGSSSSSSNTTSTAPLKSSKGESTSFAGTSSSNGRRAAGSYIPFKASPRFRSRYGSTDDNEQVPTEDLSFSILSIFLIILSPVLLFHTMLYPTRWALLVTGAHAGMAIALSSFYFYEDRTGVVPNYVLVIGITVVMAMVGGHVSFSVAAVGRSLAGFLAGLCFGTYFMCMKSGGLFPDSYAGRVAFVSVFAAIGLTGIHFKRHQTMILATAFIGTYTLFYAISDIDGANFHLAPIWLLVMPDSKDLYQIQDNDELILGLLGAVFVVAVVAQHYIYSWKLRRKQGHEENESKVNGDEERAQIGCIPAMVAVPPSYPLNLPSNLSLNDPNSCQTPPYEVPSASHRGRQMNQVTHGPPHGGEIYQVQAPGVEMYQVSLKPSYGGMSRVQPQPSYDVSTIHFGPGYHNPTFPYPSNARQ